MKIRKTWLKAILFALALCQWPAHGQPMTAGNAISLNGTNGYLTLPEGTWFSGDFTVEAWVFARSYNNWSRLFDFSDGPNNYNVYLALSYSVNGFPTMGVFTNNNGSPILAANTRLPLNQWTHLAATLSGSNATIYMNGQAVASGTLNVPPAVTRTENYIGQSAYAGDAYANAIFDEFRIWNVARTQTQIEADLNHTLHGTEAGLAGYWRFDEGTGTTAFDSSGHGQSAVLWGGATWTNSSAPLTNAADYALSFNAAQAQDVSISHRAAQDSYPFTVMCWFMEPTNSPGGGALVGNYFSRSYNGWSLAISGQLYAWYWRDPTDSVATPAAGAVNDGLWHHAAFVVDSGGGHLYLDGVLKQTVAWAGTAGPCSTTNDIYMGIYQGDSFLTADVDEVSIWNVALTQSQIQTYMDQPLQGTEAGLVNYYRFNEGIGTNIYDYTTNADTGNFSPSPPAWIISGERAGLLPAITNLAATFGLAGSATVSASVNPNGAATGVWFAYGLTTNYGTTNFVVTIDGYDPVAVSQNLTNLAANTTYHCTVIASNMTGTVSGGDVVFGSYPFVLGATSLLEGREAGVDSVVLGGLPPSYPWTASVTVPWLHLNQYTNGLGNQIVVFNFDQNPGPPRTGAIYFGSQAVTVIQAGATYLSAAGTLSLASSTNEFENLALDSGDGLYFSPYNFTQIYRSDYVTKAITQVFNGPENCYSLGVDVATNIYFFQANGAILELPFGSQTAFIKSHPSLIGTLLVAPSGDLFYSDYQNIYGLSRSSGVATLLFSLGANTSFQSWAVDAADNLYLNCYTNSDPFSTVFKWSPGTNGLTQLFNFAFPSSPMAVDGSGNVYLGAFEGDLEIWQAATGNQIYRQELYTPSSIAADNWGDVYHTEYDSSSGRFGVNEDFRAYVNGQAVLEPATAGSDSIVTAVLPTTAYLGGAGVPASSASWLTINGVTNGTISFSFSAFSGQGNRTAYLIVLGVSIPITQGTPVYSLGASATVEGAAAGTDSVVLAVSPPIGNWTNAANSPWLHLSPAMQSGAGSVPVVFSFDANTGPTRVGSLTLGGQAFTVTQAGATYVPALNPLAVANISTASNAVTSMASDAIGDVFVSTFAQYAYTNCVRGFGEWLRAGNTVSFSSTTNYYGYGASWVTADWHGNVYLNNLVAPPFLIQEYNPANGTFTTLLYTTQYVPAYFVVNSQGAIIFWDYFSHQLIEYNPATAQYETLAPGPFFPTAVAVDPAGNVFWADPYYNGLLEWNASTLQVSVVVSNLYSWSLAVDAGDNLYFTDYSPQNTPQVQKFSASTGALTTLLLAASISPQAVSVDAAGNLYVASLTSSSNSIYKIPRAFLDPTPKVEGLASGYDTLPPVVPANTDLAAPFAPSTAQPWLSITGVTNGVVGFAFSSTATARVGNITVLGVNTLVSQGTNIVLGTTNLVEGPGAGSDSFVFGSIPANVAWNTSVNVPWLHLPASGSGGDKIIFSYDANTGATRSGAITIAGQTLTVTQAGASYVVASPQTTLVSSGIDAPCGVALDPAGNVFFCDTYNNAVKEWSPANDQVSVLGSTGFNLPYALAVDGADNVYIADTFNNVLKHWSPANTNITTVVSNLSGPYGVAVDGSGNVYISDTGNGAIKEWFPANNTMVTLYSNPGSSPVGVAVDALGNVYWVESGSELVREWSVLSNRVSTLFAPGLSQPYGVAVDGSGNVYVSDYGNATTYKWTAASSTVSHFSTDPIGVAVDANDNVFIADAMQSLVYEIPRAFVDPTPRMEPLVAGQDVLPPVLPTNEDLLTPFAPVPGQPWLSITGVTNGVVGFAFSSTSAARAGYFLTVLGVNTLVSQGTNTVLGTTNLVEGPGAGSDSFVFGTIPANVVWNTSVNVPWLHVPASGSGGDKIIFSYDANTGPTRSGAITIAGQTLTVTQAGASYVAAGPQTTLVSAGIDTPYGVAVDPAGNVFFCDIYNNAVKEWSPANNQVSVLGSTGFISPYALAVDGADNVYIADTFNNVLKHWSPANTNITTVVSNLSRPYGVAVDGSGNVYISDYDNNSIKEWFPANNTMVTLYSNPGSGPLGVAVDALGNVYWAEVGSESVREWSVLSNRVSTLVVPGLRQPYGVAVDGSGNVYVPDVANETTYKWTAASNTVSHFSTDPTGVAVDGNGNVFIVDEVQSLVYEIPRAFVDPTPRMEPLAAGQDALPPVLPANEDLLTPFAPVPGQSWVNITGLAGDAIAFSFTASPSARTNTITVYGQSIPIIQQATAFPPILTGIKLTGPGTFQFSFTNVPGLSFTVLATTNLSLPLANWTVLGVATNVSGGLYQFTAAPATNTASFYRVRSP